MLCAQIGGSVCACLAMLITQRNHDRLAQPGRRAPEAGTAAACCDSHAAVARGAGADASARTAQAMTQARWRGEQRTLRGMPG
jgi:hypothetical protein